MATVNKDPYNELQYLKNLYEGKDASAGTKSWASQQAKQYYNMLDPNEAKAIQGMNATALQSYTGAKKNAQVDYTKQYQDMINLMYDQQKTSQLQQLQAQRDKAVGQINQQKSQVAPAYQQARNQTDAVNLQNVQRLREAMASAGLTASGENVTAQVAQNNQRQANLNSLNLQEQQTIDDLNRRITDLNNPADENAMMAALEAERMKALLDTSLQTDQIAYNRGRDTISDQRYWNDWNYNKEKDQSEKAWREYVFNNMSASEKAQLEWAKAQYGEEAAWRMFELNYNGELSKSLAQTQLSAYSGFNDGGEGGDYSNNYKTQQQASKSSSFPTFQSHMKQAVQMGVPTSWLPALT